MDARRLDPMPRGRICATCGGGLRFSHTAYLGRGERVAVHVCRNCGVAYRGVPRSDDDVAGAGGAGGAGDGARTGAGPGGRTAARAGQRERRGAGSRAEAREQRRRKPLPDEGAPDNPVIDEDLARRLRESLGGGGG